MINCYSMLERGGRVFWKPGIALLKKQNGLVLNGINRIRPGFCSPRKIPQSKEAYTISYLNSVFGDIIDHPLVGFDEEQNYELYSCHITEEELYIQKYSKSVLYISLTLPAVANVRLLGKTGRVYHREWIGETQRVLFSMENGGGALAIEECLDQYLLIEYVDGKFVVR